MKVGRPLKFQSVEEMQAKIDAYFASCGQKTKTVMIKGEPREVEYYIPKTITGLALALDTSRQTLIEYKERPEFIDTIKKAKEACEHDLEYCALTNNVNTTMAIFSLKNNYNWKDRTEQKIDLVGNPLKKVNNILDNLKNDQPTNENKETS